MATKFKQSEFHVTISKIVDGDTVDVDIDLGFSTILKKQRVRLMGIDTPESRTRDKVEKLFGKASKAHLKHLLSEGDITLVSHDKGKFGRILGKIWNKDMTLNYNDFAVESHHAVPYNGGNKSLTEQQHLENREWLTEQGLVV